MISKPIQIVQGFLLNYFSEFFKANDPARLIPAAAETGFVKSYDGTPIYWERHGPDPSETEATPMVFCYGLVCSMNQWRHQVEHYSQNHPCLLFDYRGHHQSGYPSDARAMNFSALAKDAAAAIHRQGFGRPAHIWGHSMGVNVALELAIAEPELCKSLVLCCGTHLSPFQKMFGTDFLEKIVAPMLKLYPQNPQIFSKVWDILMLRPEPVELLARLAGFNMGAVSRKDVQSYARAATSVPAQTFFPLLAELARGHTKGILKKVKQRTYVIAGSQDRVTPPDNQKLMAELLPNSKYIEIPTGSHNVQLDFGEYIDLKIEELWRLENLW